MWFCHGEKETGGGELRDRVVVEGIASRGARGSRMTFVHAEWATGDVGAGVGCWTGHGWLKGKSGCASGWRCHLLQAWVTYSAWERLHAGVRRMANGHMVGYA